MKNNTAGRLAEFFARLFFRLKGYRLLAKNKITGRGTSAGEIDFIACRGKTLVFVEVKKRSTAERAAGAVTRSQQKRIRTAAENFVAGQRKFDRYNLRFDVVLVCFPFYIRHIKNAF